MFRPGDFERARDRVGEVMGIKASDGGEETVKRLRSVQRCWCSRLCRISMARLSRGDFVVVLARRVETDEGSAVDMVICGLLELLGRFLKCRANVSVATSEQQRKTCHSQIVVEGRNLAYESWKHFHF